MAVNRAKNHLVIFLEDKPYREIVNGAKLSLNINGHVLDDKNPSGGWAKVFNDLQDNLRLLNSRTVMYALLLIDFDHQLLQRKERFDALLVDQVCKDRVFILGIDKKESEDLKRSMAITDYEKIGRLLVENCHHHMAELWKNKHLSCNMAEVERIRQTGVFG